MKKLLLLITSLFIILCSSLKGQHDIVKKGDKMPSFQLESYANGNIDSEQLKGKVTLIIIFATWCSPCQKELGALQEIIDNKEIPFEKDNPHLAILVVGRGHTEKELENYKAEKQFTFPLYPDPEKDFTKKFAKQSIPRTYLVDKDSKIVYTSTGYSEQEFKKLVKTINKLLSEK